MYLENTFITLKRRKIIRAVTAENNPEQASRLQQIIESGAEFLLQSSLTLQSRNRINN